MNGDFTTVPKRRRKAIFGNIRRQLGPVLHALAQQQECQILEGRLMSDHVHICITLPPKQAVASVIGFLKGKSAIAMARMCGKERNRSGEHFWAHGYAVSTVGFELEQVRKYTGEQALADGNPGAFYISKKARNALRLTIGSTAFEAVQLIKPLALRGCLTAS